MLKPIIKVAIQGDRASFHEIAAYNYHDQPIELLYCDSFEAVFENLMNGTADRAFVAISNNNHGDIDEVTQLIDKHPVIHEGEYLLPITQRIIGLPGTDLAVIKTIISHPVALSQCRRTLARRFGYVELNDYHDTSAAVAHVKARADSTVGAIASEAAARLHGLEILESSVQDDPYNATLFRSLRRLGET